MGNYLFIKNRKGLISELRGIYNRYHKSGKEKFLNDFGDLNTFEDVFEITEPDQEELRFKTGVMKRNFYSEEFVEEVKKVAKEMGEVADVVKGNEVPVKKKRRYYKPKTNKQ